MFSLQFHVVELSSGSRWGKWKKFAGPLPRACQIIRGEALWILTSTFHFYHFCFIFWNFCNRNQLKQPFSINFSKPEPWTRIRTTFWARTIVSCLRSAHARGAVREPRATVIVGSLRQGETLFLKRFSERFFSQSWCQMEPQIAWKIKENLKTNRLGTKPTKHVENALILEPSDL